MKVETDSKLNFTSKLYGDFTWKKPLELFEEKKVVKICAPMVRYSKLAFRKLVRKYGCDLAFTPMIVADAFVLSSKARDSEFTTCNGDRPLIVQFAAKNSTDFAKASELVAPFCDGVDLNCGCPQRWAMAEGYGAHLISHPELMRDMVLQTKNRIPSTDFTISVKIRIHNDLKKTVNLCQSMEQAGVSWITVHGRTVEQRSEPVNLDAIKIIQESINIPTIANGDVKTLADAENVHQLTSAKGVMAARGILQNPAMFSGYASTPTECISDWLNFALETGTPLTCLQHHLIYMTERIVSRPNRKLFASLNSVTSILDFLDESYGIKPD